MPPRQPPAALLGHVSRREAARLLGFGSDFRVRQLEKAGRLRAVRGALGQAWYPRPQVMALLADPPDVARQVGRVAGEAARAGGPPVAGRWSDAALIAHLRAAAQAAVVLDQHAPRTHRPAPTVVDLVADTGVSIARAQRVFRFWMTHDAHPAVVNLRAGAARAGRPAAPSSPAPKSGSAGSVESPISGEAIVAERRAPLRVQRDDLIRRLRDPDPAAREAAFRKLRELRESPEKNTASDQ